MRTSRVLSVVSLLSLAVFGLGCKATSNALNAASQPSSQPSAISMGVQGAASLVRLLGSGDAAAKSRAKTQLLQLGVRAVPALIGALKGGNNATKKGALDVLGKMGTKARGARSAVKSLTNSSDAGVKSAANTTLKKIGG